MNERHVRHAGDPLFSSQGDPRYVGRTSLVRGLKGRRTLRSLAVCVGLSFCLLGMYLYDPRSLLLLLAAPALVGYWVEFVSRLFDSADDCSKSMYVRPRRR